MKYKFKTLRVSHLKMQFLPMHVLFPVCSTPGHRLRETGLFFFLRVLSSPEPFYYFIVIITIWPCRLVYGTLVPQPGIQQMPPALEAQSRNH